MSVIKILKHYSENLMGRLNIDLLLRVILALMLVSLGLLMASCGTFDKQSDPVFSQYKHTFEEITGHSLSGLPIIFGDSSGRFPWSKDGSSNTIGMCRTIQVDGRWHDKYITIDRDIWDYMPESAREHIIFHEVIHCELEVPDHTHHWVDYEGYRIPHLMNEQMDETLDLPLDVYRDQLKEYSL